jgi:ubiquinol-cytochrome c reductase cytochrome b subunit
MKALVNWLDSRTGIRDLVHEALYESIPGGARWRYVWGSTLVFAFVVQVITGFALWMYYSPSAQTAWESVYYIQHEAQGGWLLRGIHHFMAQAMIVLLVLHLMQVVIDGAYRAPREVNFWLGLVLMQIVLGLSLTGYLLPWDQKGYWATRVATNLIGVVPLVGPQLQQIVVGGADYGHHTLTRFFALHAGILPASLVFFLVLHVALFRKHGIHHKLPPKFADTSFWPDQVLKDAVACLAVLCVVLFLCMKPMLFGGAEGGALHLGAELGAPADPSNQYSAARPEWYFLFLFQFLKLFEGWGEQGELLGAIVIPGLVMGGLFLMPLIGRWKLGHRFNIFMLLLLMVGVGYLTVAAVREDYQANWTDEAQFAEIEPVIEKLGNDKEKISAHFAGDQAKIADYERQYKAYEHYRKSKEYLQAVEDAEHESHRVIELAAGPGRIPATGAVTLLREDPQTQGPKLFAQHCASCHTYLPPPADPKAAPPAALAKATAPNLYGFASRPWLTGFLNPAEIAGPAFFGGTAHAEGEMVSFVKDTMTEWPPEDVKKVVVALSAEAQLKSQRAADEKDAAEIEAGKALIADADKCASCHHFHEAGELGAAPDLTGYGSREWLVGMISNPAHERFYRDANDRMPAFAEHGGNSSQNLLSEKSIGLIVDWLRGEWFEPEVDQVAAKEAAPAETSAAPKSEKAGEPAKVDAPAKTDEPPKSESPAEPAKEESPAPSSEPAAEPAAETPAEPAAETPPPATEPPQEAPSEPAAEPPAEPAADAPAAPQ